MVIAIPAPLVIQRKDEQIGAFEIFQRFLPGSRRMKQHSLTKRATQTVEDGGAQQESLDVGGLLLQNFFDEIVHDKLMAAGERLNESGRVFLSLHGQRG